MKVTVFGAAGAVTGSCHLVEAAGKRILLDCGMIQGSKIEEAKNALPFDFDVKTIDAVILSHAHIDHCGRLPVLSQFGYHGPIYTHRATADLLPVMLEDAASLAEMDAERRNRFHKDGHNHHKPLFTRHDVGQVARQLERLDYRKPETLFPGVTVTLQDAGHILGSASVRIQAEEGGKTRTLVFSGDIGPLNTPMLADPDPFPQADLVLMESTYGGRLHRERAATVQEMGEIFDAAWKAGGNILIPAFAVGRSQELLYWFAKHYDDWNLGRWRIFMDSPMASKVIEVYDRHEELFDDDAKAMFHGKPHPFRLPNLKYTTDVEDSKAINEHNGGCIIIAGSGMCNGGRIRHHLRHNLGSAKNHVLFVGYQSVGTLGRLLVDGIDSIKLFGDDIKIKAHRHTIGGLSAHTDQAGLLEWYGAFSVHPPVALVHGEDDSRKACALALKMRFDVDAQIPDYAQTFTI
ncbi:MAG: MBL fold metallo-hydrolase [Arenimonas sp.]|uniref:MBL fold metallo-hydrolase n=1 Tax=Arenimonas sp. TaxID=1872635 RepID=UPI003C0851E5